MKIYKTRSGLPARVICDDANSESLYPVVALYTKGGYEHVAVYTKELKVYAGSTENDLDLIEVSAWDALNVDDTVLMRDGAEQPWQRGYFAGIVDGKPTVWTGGTTSFTAEDIGAECWEYCEKYVGEWR